MPYINLTSSDGITFKVDIDIAKISETIRLMIDALGLEEDEKEIVPLPNLHSSILEMVIKWATFHKNKPIPQECFDKNPDNMSVWDANFFDVDQATLQQLIMAANYLNIAGMLDLACKKLASIIKGKTPQELRKNFNIKNDIDDKERKELFESKVWIDL